MSLLEPRGLISVDDHLIEPPNLFTDFCSAEVQEHAPKWGHRGQHCGWTFGDTFYGVSKAATAAGQPWGKAGIFVPSESVPEGLDDPHARLRAMDEDGIAMSLCFPSMMGLGGETVTKHVLNGLPPDIGMELLGGYNRFLLRYWCAADHRRFIPAVALPLWSGRDSAEVANAAFYAGAKAVLFPQAPQQIGLPPVWHPHWAPLLRTCEERGLVLVTHIFSDDSSQYMDASLPPYLRLTLARTTAIETIAAWITTPALDNFPGLRIMVAESGVGWIPWFLALANESARLHSYEFGRMAMLPLQRFEKHFGLSILGNEIVAPGTIESLPEGTQRRLMFESDYPHLDGSFPQSQAAFAGLGIPDWMRPGVARDNAAAFFNLDRPFEFPRMQCRFVSPDVIAGGWRCSEETGHEPPHVGPVSAIEPWTDPDEAHNARMEALCQSEPKP